MQRVKPAPTGSSGSHDVQRYQAQVQAELKQALETVNTLNDTASHIGQVADTVRSLPTKLREQVLVPFGKQAFFLGQTCHTNEITMHLGSKYYAECTAAHAAGVLDRRQQLLRRNAEEVGQQVHKLEARLKLAGQELVPGAGGKDSEGLVHDDGEEVVEIRETLEESEALLGWAAAGRAAAPPRAAASSPPPGSGGGFDELFARVEELERMEAEAERASGTRQQQAGTGPKSRSPGSAPSDQEDGRRPTSNHLAPSADDDDDLDQDFFTPIPLDDFRLGEKEAQEAAGKLAEPAAASTTQAANAGSSTQAASPAPQPARPGALKKGFFDAPSKPRALTAQPKASSTGSNAGGAAASGSKSSRDAAPGGAAALEPPPQQQQQQRRAFTGLIVERGGDAVPAAHQALPRAGLPGTGTSAAASSASKAPSASAHAAQPPAPAAGAEPVHEAPKRASKFKQQMLQQRGGA